MSRTAWILALALAAAAPDLAHGQVFLASRPNPGFTIGPLFVQATVTPDAEVVTLDVLWSLVIPPTTAGASVEQDLYLLWPNKVTLFLDSSEGISPQVLTVQFGYFRGMRSWAPVLIPIAFFALGNLAMPMFMMLVRRVRAVLTARVQFGPGSADRQTGVVLSRDTLARIVPGQTTYEEVLRFCGPEAEEHEQLTVPRRTLIYRGRRVVPQGRRRLGWLSTVRRWSIEQHEVEITLERDVVTDVQARVRRSPLAQPEAAPAA